MEKIEPIAEMTRGTAYGVGTYRHTFHDLPEGTLLYSQATVDQLVEALEGAEAELKDAYAERRSFQDGLDAALNELAATEALLAKYREFVQLLADYIPASAIGNTTVQQALTTTPTAALNNAIADELECLRDRLAVAENPLGLLDMRAKELRSMK